MHFSVPVLVVHTKSLNASFCQKVMIYFIHSNIVMTQTAAVVVPLDQ